MSSNEPSNRHLHWSACYNVRDLGGCLTDDGVETRRGLIVRADSVGRLGERGRAALEAYGIRTIIDLRTPVEVRDEPSPFIEHATIMSHLLSLNPNDSAVSKATTAHQVSGLSYMAAINAAFLSVNGDQIAAIIRTIADAPDGGVLFHCHAGRDRTGLIAALLLGVAGVPHETIVADYALSFNAVAETMAATLTHIESAYGGVDAYLRAAGVTEEESTRIDRRLRVDQTGSAS